MINNDDQFTPSASAKADDIFFDALGVEQEEDRKAFLIEACKGDDALRREVDSLFVLLNDMGDFLESDADLRISAKDLFETIDDLQKSNEHPKPLPCGNPASE